MYFPPLRSFLRLAVASILLSFFIPSFATASSSPPAAASSPAVEGEIICHTDNPAECYPKVFSATEHFQVVHDDQDLPPGLHVRLNIWTGEKEARLNTPMPDDPALEGLPVDQAIVVVDHVIGEQKPEIPSGAPAYDPIGRGKEPQEKDPNFAVAMEYLKTHAETAPCAKNHPLDEALTDLEDISHDMYYGQKITEDFDALKALFCLLTQRDKAEVKDRPLPERRDFLASAVLSSSAQNNPPALRDIEAAWSTLMEKQCAFHQKPLKDVFYGNLEPQSQPGTDEYSNEATWTRTSLPVLSRLLKSDKIRPEFLNNDGMKQLLQILLTEGSEWEAARRKVATMVSDVFLDDSVGAKPNVWPLGPVNEKSVCEKDSTRLDDGCWEHHLEKISQVASEEDWSNGLLSMLRQRRPGVDHPRNEL